MQKFLQTWLFAAYIYACIYILYVKNKVVSLVVQKTSTQW